MSEETPKKLGRPTDYKDEYCQMLIDHMEQGKSFETFAAKLRTSVKTIYRWLQSHDDFCQAKEIGESLSREFWESHGIDGLYSTTDTERDGRSYITKSKAINSAMWLANVKKRFHDWNDDLFKPKDYDKDKLEERPVLNIIINDKSS